MKFCGILFSVVVLISLCGHCEGLFSSLSLQDYVDSFVDVVKSLAFLRLPNYFDQIVVKLCFYDLVVISVVV